MKKRITFLSLTSIMLVISLFIAGDFDSTQKTQPSTSYGYMLALGNSVLTDEFLEDKEWFESVKQDCTFVNDVRQKSNKNKSDML